MPDADQRVSFFKLFSSPLFLKETSYLFWFMELASGIMHTTRVITSNSWVELSLSKDLTGNLIYSVLYGGSNSSGPDKLHL